MKAFAVHCVILIILPIRFKISRSDVFFCFTRQNKHTWKITSVGLRDQAWESASNRYRARNLSKPVVSRSSPITEVVLKNSQNSQEKTCQSLLMKKRLRHRCYLLNLVKFWRVFVNSFWIFKHSSRNKFCHYWRGFNNS